MEESGPIMDVRRAVEERVSRSGLRGRGYGLTDDTTRLCPLTFEERFYDPDHPQDSDWVADVNYELLFSHLKGRRFTTRTVRASHHDRA